MSDSVKHECGIVQIRLRRPLEHYRAKYGEGYGLGKLYLAMEKQHNRGQEGAGLAVVKIDASPGSEYIFRERAEGQRAIRDVFERVNADRARARTRAGSSAGGSQGETAIPFEGELMIGHLRYSTGGRSGVSFVHPFLRRSNWPSRNMALAGNFSMTNTDEILQTLVAEGQHPRNDADTFILLEQLGGMLDSRPLDPAGKNASDIASVLRKASATWDGGYVITGVLGSGEGFTLRDPWGIRSAHYYVDDEIVMVASERAVIQTVMNLATDEVRELQPGEALIVDREGGVELAAIRPAESPRPCSFERIYFSRGTDADIYRERKALGRFLVPDILREIDHDIDHSVFSFIPNTAEVAWYGMMEGLETFNDERKVRLLTALGASITPDEIRQIVNCRVRTEKLAVKDIKLRTFIAEGERRNELAAHVYDITYGSLVPGEDNVVVIDDSIVRGTTLKKSIVKILSRLKPRKIVIVSSSPQVRYPDCYGIDMSRMDEFIAFAAAVSLLRERGREGLLDEVYARCKAAENENAPGGAPENAPGGTLENHVKAIYDGFSYEEISSRIARMVTPEDCECPVAVVYQTVEKLSEACPRNNGDWYFSGDYPTPGGVRAVNRAYVNWYESRAAENE
ncbi:MAG: amidophosphoribosyltransferase [Alistipes sp.]|jgi:amidophosphoribosyltransferase|nr:amidophosphoribosyltransferase [Alistipes sp.]